MLCGISRMNNNATLSTGSPRAPATTKLPTRRSSDTYVEIREPLFGCYPKTTRAPFQTIAHATQSLVEKHCRTGWLKIPVLRLMM